MERNVAALGRQPATPDKFAFVRWLAAWVGALQAGLTQQQLGEGAGIHKLTVAKLEQGIREPSWATAMALAEALGVSCEAFASNGSTEAATARPRGRPRKQRDAETPPPSATPALPPEPPAAAPAKGKPRKRKGE